MSFEIVYKVGASNRVVEALSRRDEDKELQGIARPFWPDIAEFDEEVKKDLVLAQSLEDLKVDPNSHP